jgi:hypothetical protein
MKNYIIKYIGLALFSLLILSCEKVIEIDLNEIDQKIIVEGVVMEGVGNNFVLISKTTDYFDVPKYLFAGGGTITIKDGLGTDHICNELDTGIYFAPTLNGVPGDTYSISVSVDEEDIKSASTMPLMVPVDSIVAEFRNDFGPDGFYVANVHYTDPIDQENYYKYDLYLNNEKQYGIQLNNDLYSNGSNTYAQLFFTEEVSVDDTIMVIMHSIDKANYRYLSAIATGGFGGGAETIPGNPESNLDGNALGYFGAYSSSVGFDIVK